MRPRETETLASDQEAFHVQLSGLGPVRRREAVQALIQARAKNGRRSLLLLVPIAFAFSVLTAFSWLDTYQMGEPGTIGSVAGVLLGLVGLLGLRRYKVDAFAKIASGEFSDDDVLAWSMQEQSSNQTFLADWRRYGRYLLPAGLAVIAILAAIPSTEAFVTMLLLSSITTFLVILVLLPVTRHRLIDRLPKRR